MSQASAALARIQELQKEIATLQSDALRELQSERAALLKQITSIDSQIAGLTGVPAEKKAEGEAKELSGKSIPLQELKELLAAAPDKTINIRKEGLQLANIKTLAKYNPQLLSLGGKGAWPTVTMLK